MENYAKVLSDLKISKFKWERDNGRELKIFNEVEIEASSTVLTNQNRFLFEKFRLSMEITLFNKVN